MRRRATFVALAALLGGCRPEVGSGPAVPPRPGPVKAGAREPPRALSSFQCLRLADGRVATASFWAGGKTYLEPTWISDAPVVDFACLENPQRVEILRSDGRVVSRLRGAHDVGPERPGIEAKGAEWIGEVLDGRVGRVTCATGGGQPVRCDGDSARVVAPFEAMGIVRRLYVAGAAALLEDGRFVVLESGSWRGDAKVTVMLDRVVRASVTDIDVGHHVGCLLRDDGSVWCWGMNEHGELGDGTRTRHDQPVRVLGLPRAVDVSTSGYHACAIDEGGKVWCWGRTGSGEAGKAASKATRAADVCPVDEQATAKAREEAKKDPCGPPAAGPGGDDPCRRAMWNARRAGAGEIVIRKRTPGCVMPGERKEGVGVPVQVEEIEGAVALEAAPEGTCGLRGDGVLVCWGHAREPWVTAFPVKGDVVPGGGK